MAVEKFMKLLLVAGLRPDYMKIAPIVRALAAARTAGTTNIRWKLVHTGQHLDRGMIGEFGLDGIVADAAITLIDPLPYQAFVALWKDAALVLTDSGGLQEVTTALGIPCFTLSENTERPITIEEGTNVLVDTSKETILAAYGDLKAGRTPKGRIPEFWDGRAAERIVAVLSGRGI